MSHGRISPPPADARPTNISWIKETRLIFSKRREKLRKQNGFWQLPNNVNERFVSVSLDGTARPVFPTGLARPNAAFGWGDSACQDCLKKGRISPSLEARIAEALSKTCLDRAKETDGPPPRIMAGETAEVFLARDRLSFCQSRSD